MRIIIFISIYFKPAISQVSINTSRLYFLLEVVYFFKYLFFMFFPSLSTLYFWMLSKLESQTPKVKKAVHTIPCVYNECLLQPSKPQPRDAPINVFCMSLTLNWNLRRKSIPFYAFLFVRVSALHQDKLSPHNFHSLWWIHFKGKINQLLHWLVGCISLLTYEKPAWALKIMNTVFSYLLFFEKKMYAFPLVITDATQNIFI